MCGIAAVFAIGRSVLDDEDRAAADRMIRAMAHRGPDGDHAADGAGHALRFARLAVFGLADGRQPFASPDGRLLTMVNGEIYNHAELRARDPGRPVTGTSDCAVVHDLFPEHREKVFPMLRGMYAACLLDRERHELHLVRDPFGVKPLYYSRLGDRIHVASELKGLFAGGTPATPDWGRALRDSSFTITGGVSTQTDQTYFLHARTVPAGGGVTIDLRTGEERAWEHWRPPVEVVPSPVATSEPEAYTREYRRLFEQAVRRSCMTETPMSVFLSGGVDSVAVAALAARERELTAWTVLSPSTVESGDFAAAVDTSRKLGIDLHWVDTCDVERGLTAQDWLWVLRCAETPLAGPEQFYKLLMLASARAAGMDFKAILTGQGSDEFNGGYSTVVNLAGDGSWAGFEAALTSRVRRSLLDALPGSYGSLEEAVGPCLRTEWLAERLGGRAGDPYDGYILGKAADLQRFNCWHEDRVASAYAAESRPVFLDVDLVEFSIRLPARLRPVLLDDKRILRDAVRGLVPPEIAERKKAPFFYAADRTVALAMLRNLLARHGDTLVEAATAGAVSGTVLDPDALRSAIRHALDHPLGAGLEQVLRLISLGALETVLASPEGHARPAGGTLSAPASSLSASPGVDEETSRARVRESRPRIGADTVVGLLGDVVLLTPHGPGQDAQETLLIARAGTIEYEVTRDADPALFDVLRALTAPRTIAELAGSTGFPQEQVETAAESLLRYALAELTES
ncbi:asparagine synthase (glutamine-hydrolyzing) [Microbispora sp. NPDC046973]|uniref:asparagine synthase (glutamine-hydrolyzing) n=1 Tax=Microbispora sp. NPDC046973 TaxID=3155022 RepID=UPI0034014CF6